MENDDAIKGTIFTRRQVIRGVLQASAGLALFGLLPRRAHGTATPATCPSLPLMAAPQLTEGPFFVDEKLNRSNILGNTTRDTVVSGLPLGLTFTVYRMQGKDISPMKNVQVDVWHADVAGVYSDESNPMNHQDTAKQNWLRGFQITDEAGNANFQTIFPGWYEGRAPHIHFKVRKTTEGKTLEFTSQLFLNESDSKKIYSAAPYKGRGEQDTHNGDDMVYTEQLADGTMAGTHLLLDLQKNVNAHGYTAAFPLILTDQSFGAARSGHGPGGPGGPDDDFSPPTRWLAWSPTLVMSNAPFH